MRLGRRRGLLAAFSAVLLGCSLTATAWALDELTQKPGTAGCVSQEGGEGCQSGIGLLGAESVAVSPDGKNVYAASAGPGAVAIFSREPDGTLEQLPGAAGCVSQVDIERCGPGIGLLGATGVAVSPDGRNVYVSSNGDTVAFFKRNPDGTLEQLPEGCISQGGVGGCRTGRGLDRANSVVVSPDGANVYVASFNSSAVAIFKRNPDGTLGQLPASFGCISQGGIGGCRPGRALDFANSVATSPDGKSVYVASIASHAVAIFKRNPDGTLEQSPTTAGCVSQGGAGGCQPGIALGAAVSVATSPDGRNVYVGSNSSSAVAILKRNPDGTLEQLPGAAGCIAKDGNEGCRPVNGLGAPAGIVTSPDGRALYVASASTNRVSILERRPDGTLVQPSGSAVCISQGGSEGCRSGIGLDRPVGVAASPDGNSVYVASADSNAVAILDLTVPQPPTLPPDTVAPAVSGFKLAPKRFRAAPRGRSRFRFRLSEVASVTIEIDRVRRKRFNRAGRLVSRGRPAGVNKLSFKARLRGRLLKPGSYRATITATDAAGNRSAPKRARFTVLTPRR